MEILETTSPLDNIDDSDISRMPLLFNYPPSDLSRPVLKEIVAIQRGLRGRKISAETSEIKPRKQRAAKPQEVSVEVDEDPGF